MATLCRPVRMTLTFRRRQRTDGRRRVATILASVCFAFRALVECMTTFHWAGRMTLTKTGRQRFDGHGFESTVFAVVMLLDLICGQQAHCRRYPYEDQSYLHNRPLLVSTPQLKLRRPGCEKRRRLRAFSFEAAGMPKGNARRDVAQ